MAVMVCELLSTCIKRRISFNAIIPSPVFSDLYEPQNTYQTTEPLKTVYLLHGKIGSHNDWLYGSRIEKIAHDFNMAIIMPSCENSYFVDMPNGESFGEYLGSELIKATRSIFNLSHKKQDTLIAGFSMGAYGALRNGIKYSDIFGTIGAFSNGVNMDKIVSSDENAPLNFNRRTFYKSVFGDLDKLKNSDMCLEYLVDKKIESGEQLPNIYMACGLNDFVLENNRRLNTFLVEKGINTAYIEDDGIHNMEFWDKHIERFIAWYLRHIAN